MPRECIVDNAERSDVLGRVVMTSRVITFENWSAHFALRAGAWPGRETATPHRSCEWKRSGPSTKPLCAEF
jgi:hypothetical protein